MPTTRIPYGVLDGRYVNAEGDNVLGDLNFADGKKIVIDEIRARDADGLKLYEDGSNGIFIKDGGNVGVGIADPLGSLHVFTDYNNQMVIGDVTPNTNKFSYILGTQYHSDSEPEGVALLGTFCDNTDNRVIFGGGHGTKNAATSVRFYTAANVTTLNGTERMRITNAGNIGINTSGPDRRLDVLDASSPQLRLTHTDGNIYTDFQTTSNGNIVITPTGYVILTSNKDTTGDPTGVEGMIYINTNDNVIKMYADGGWRTLTSW